MNDTMHRTGRAAIAALALAAVAAAQPPQRPEPPRAAPADQAARAAKLLAAHAARSKDVGVLVADFVPRRTTTLLQEPLVSKGRFLFVREPAAVVFSFTAPRVSTARLTASTYEVHRPHKRQLERFHLDGPELANGLFAAVGGDVQRLERDFVVVSCTDGDEGSGTAVVRLEPRDDAMRARLQQLVVTLDANDGALRAVGYRDHAGDRIHIELSGVALDPADAPSAALVVPEGTTVVEHGAARTKAPPPPARK